ncbi:rRNA maturation RNase YbeY [Flavobacteriales bacterium]|nr:rRNA maturation RNase YbeY [Flavobacteriales bacterium]
MPISFHNADHPYRCPQRRLIKTWLTDVVQSHQKSVGDVSIVFCTDAYLLTINQDHLKHDYYTDIITFDYCEGPSVSGELYISIDRVKDNAKTHKQLFNNELNRVIVHGVLHLLGYMDKSKAEQTQMTHLENKWLTTFNTLNA